MQRVNTNGDIALFQEIQSLRNAVAVRFVLHFNLSRLQLHHRSEFQTKIALNILYDVFRGHNGTIFGLSDSDIAVVFHGKDRNMMDKAIFQLRYLYADDPLATYSDGTDNPAFCTIYDLAKEWRHYFRLCASRANVSLPLEDRGDDALRTEPEVTPESFATRARLMEPVVPPAAPVMIAPVAASIPDEPGFTPIKLAALKQKLASADVVPVLRRQPICAIRHNVDAKMVPVFHEMYMNIRHLEQVLDVNYPLSSNRHLFRYLTEQLDDRMLELLMLKPNIHITTPISLNLNVRTILSERFQQFIRRLNETVRIKLVVEVQVGDVFDDMKAFLAARQIVKDAGYRLCLDGLTVESFGYVDRQQLGFDLVKLQWNADASTELSSDKNKLLAAAIARCGQNRLILCRCDDRRAIAYGQGLGISLFQGRHTDTVLDPKAMVMN